MITTHPRWDLEGASLPVGTLYGIGRNYAAHAREMGAEVPADPLVFLKPPSAYVPSGAAIALPSWTSDVHHEVELVVVIGHDGIAGLGVGLDLTARDVQAAAKQAGTPWAVAKGWKGSAPVSRIVPWPACGTGPWTIALSVDGEERQRGNTSMMERSIDQLIAYLDGVFGLVPGDAIFTGTPEGVGPLHGGQRAVATLDDLAQLEVSIV